MTEITIPRLDLNDYVHGSAEQKAAFSNQIGQALPKQVLSPLPIMA